MCVCVTVFCVLLRLLIFGPHLCIMYTPGYDRSSPFLATNPSNYLAYASQAEIFNKRIICIVYISKRTTIDYSPTCNRLDYWPLKVDYSKGSGGYEATLSLVNDANATAASTQTMTREADATSTPIAKAPTTAERTRKLLAQLAQVEEEESTSDAKAAAVAKEPTSCPGSSTSHTSCIKPCHAPVPAYKQSHNKREKLRLNLKTMKPAPDSWECSNMWADIAKSQNWTMRSKRTAIRNWIIE